MRQTWDSYYYIDGRTQAYGARNSHVLVFKGISLSEDTINLQNNDQRVNTINMYYRGSVQFVQTIDVGTK